MEGSVTIDSYRTIVTEPTNETNQIVFQFPFCSIQLEAPEAKIGFSAKLTTIVTHTIRIKKRLFQRKQLRLRIYITELKFIHTE